MADVFKGIQPEKVWYYFGEICKYPRPSKKEEKIAAYIKGWAKDKGFEVQEDDLGNFVVRKPATKGMENRKPVIIQGHIDMVCEKNANSNHDFDNDPIEPYVEDDWVKAKGTTLGADNGVGVAMGMAVLDSDDVPHPPIELLCTLDEETGLTGAMSLSPDLLQGDILINLDSEEDGAFTIGCAGGQNTSASYNYDGETPPNNYTAFKVSIKGLMGGHSGIEIHDGRANAIKFLNRMLWTAKDKFDLKVSSIDGGNAHNAIPREAFAVVTVPKDSKKDFKDFVKNYDEMIKVEYQSKEKNIEAVIDSTDMPERVMTKGMQYNLLDSVYAAPHGVYRMSPDIEGLVQTSTNLAVIQTRENDVYILTSQRSSIETEKADMANMVKAAMKLGGAEVSQGDGYPAWEPNMDSEILNTAKDIFVDLFHKEPKIEAIHAGLECGLIGVKYSRMDMLSFGPTLKDVHSPDERISISTTQNCWNLLLGVLKNIPAK